MFLVVNKNNKVIASSDLPVNEEDCASREERVIEIDNGLYNNKTVNSLYKGGKFIPPPTPFHIISDDGEWVDGRSDEVIWKQVRNNRNKALTKTDWTIIPDAPLTPEKVIQFRDWRKLLRDLPGKYTVALEAEEALNTLLEQEPVI